MRPADVDDDHGEIIGELRPVQDFLPPPDQLVLRDGSGEGSRVMPMKNSPHPGEVIREEVIEALGLTIGQAAEILDVRQATLSDMVDGKASLTAEMALRLEKAFGASMELLLRMQAGHDAAQAQIRSDQIKVGRFVPGEASPT